MFAIDPDHPDVVAIKKHIKEVRFRKGEIILHPYEDTAFLHVIRSGLVKAYTINSRGEEAINVIYGQDDLFPLAWIINQQRQPVYFQALTECRAVLVPQDVFLEYIQSSAAITYAVMQKILEQTTLFASRINNLEFKFARERLAYRLLVLAAKFGEPNKRGEMVIPHISQQDLAATINVSRESVSREISRFEKLGCLIYKSSGIVIKNQQQLHDEVRDTVIMYYDSSLNPEQATQRQAIPKPTR